MRIYNFLFLTLVSSILGYERTAAKPNEKNDKRPNILLIMADDVGYGDLSCNGIKTVKTPNVEKLASEGIRFTNAHSAAATSTPARYAMLTGEYAWRKEGTGIADGDAAMIISSECYTIADMFKDAGYRTGVIGKWHLGLGSKTGGQNWNNLIRPNPADIGFDYSYIMAATGDRVPCIWIENGRAVNLDPADPVSVSYKENFIGEPTGKDNPELLRLLPSRGHNMSIVNGISRIGFMKGGKSALWRDQDIQDSIISHAIRFIENRSIENQPFFLYLATNDIHVPRDPNERFIGKSGMGARGDAILEFDWGVGKVMETLERLHLDENTIVILSSDNGPVVDDGYKDKAKELLGDHKPAGRYRGGKYSLFEGGTRVPCIIRWEKHISSGVSNQLMCQMDWFRSFANLLNVKLPNSAAPDSENHLFAWMNAKTKGRSLLVEQNMVNNLSITDGFWKYIPANSGSEADSKAEIELGNGPNERLYKISVDPSESKNVIHENPNRAKKLDEQLKAIIVKTKDK